MRLPNLSFTVSLALAIASLGVHSLGAHSRREGTIALTAPMPVARSAHSATTMSDGDALVVGGFNDENDAAFGVARYDARRGRFTSLARMLAIRHSHSATVLPNGKVLIAGGYVAGNAVTPTAELYDPATNRFSSTGSMRAARAGHVAVLLASGKVLIAGGVGPEWSFLSSAELYDPGSGSFTATNPMTVARESHVGVGLKDGRVLIVGGHRDRRANITIYASAELFDPVSNSFVASGEMHTRRHKHDAVLLRDGRVLITGGSDERDERGAYRSTEYFDPATNTFQPGPEMVRARYKHQGTSILLPSGQVLIAGGAAQAEIFDPVVQRFSIVAGEAGLAGQFSAAALLGDGSVLITGGYGNGTGPRATAWRYRP